MRKTSTANLLVAEIGKEAGYANTEVIIKRKTSHEMHGREDGVFSQPKRVNPKDMCECLSTVAVRSRQAGSAREFEQDRPRPR